MVCRIFLFDAGYRLVIDGSPYRPLPKAPVCRYPHYDVRAAT